MGQGLWRDDIPVDIFGAKSHGSKAHGSKAHGSNLVLFSSDTFSGILLGEQKSSHLPGSGERLRGCQLFVGPGIGRNLGIFKW